MNNKFESVMWDLGIRPSSVIHALEVGMHKFEENAGILREEGSGTLESLAEEFERYAEEARKTIAILRGDDEEE